jgi:MYXO-CTERM domain-containing protein
VAAICVFASSVFAIATVEISTTNGAPGGAVVLTMSITREASDPAFAGTQIDIIIDRTQLGMDAQCSETAMPCDSGLDCEDAEACALLSCEADPRLPASLQLIANSPRFQNLPGVGNKRIRLGIVGPVIPVTTFEDGVVLTCELDIPDSAELGVQSLGTDRLVVSDENGDLILSQVVVIPGQIVDPNDLTPTVTNTEGPTETPTGGDQTPTSTATPTGSGPATLTPTATPVVGTNTPSTPIEDGTPTHTGTAGIGTPTPTATPTDGGGGGGDGCDCSITPVAADASGIAWFLLLPAALLWRSRRQH